MPAGAAPGTGWVPANAGMLGSARRLLFTSSGTMLAGSLSWGPHVSVGGAAWAPVSPVLPACGNTISCAFEALVEDPGAASTIYATTYDLHRDYDGLPRIDPGGVVRTYDSAGDTGAAWYPLLSGVRGNALAIARRDGDAAPRLIAGRIQAAPWDVGTDANEWCAAVQRDDRCSPSVYVSGDGGRSWSPRYFEGSRCPNGQGAPRTSSRIVSWVGFDHAHPGVVYASANSGLWVSTDDAATWRIAFEHCGGLSPGVALAGDDAVYLGTSDGALYVADRDARGPGTFRALALDLPIAGAIQSIVPDTRDPAGLTMFVASWAAVSGQQAGGVYRVTRQGSSARVTDLGHPATAPVTGVHPWVDGLTRGIYRDWQSLFLVQSPLDPDLIYLSGRHGSLFVRSDGA